MARAPRPGRGSPEVRSRARRIAGRRFRREFGERFLKRLGFSGDDFAKGGLVKKKLGLFGGSISTTRPGDSGPGPAPPVEQPERVTNESNPSITTIVGQLDKLVKTANKVGILTKEQQEAMLGQLSQARRIAKEQILENKRPAIPEPMDTDSGDALTPLGDIIADLKKQLDKLSGKVEEKVDEQKETDSNDRGFAERFFDRYDMGDEYRTRRRRRAARARRIAPDQLLDKNGNPLRGAALESRKRKILADRAAAAARGGNAFTRMFRRTPSVVPAQGAASSRIAQAMGQGASRAANLARAGGGSVKNLVRRAAGPIIARGLGNTALKSIPIIGAVAGVGFAADRLIKGDVLGAGLDLISGLGGPLTAIPALVASTARDVYSSVFGVQPEQDPEFSKRMPEVTAAVEGLVKEQIGGSVEPKQRPTLTQVDEKTVPQQPPQAPPQRESAPTLGTPPSPPPVTAAPPAPSSSGAPATAAGAAATSADATPVAGQEDAPVESAPIAAITNTADTGAQLNAASMPPEVPVVPNMYGFNQSTGRFSPQTAPTSKSGHVGIGNVPNPDYIPSGVNNLSTLFNAMFFNVNYQEQ